MSNIRPKTPLMGFQSEPNRQGKVNKDGQGNKGQWNRPKRGNWRGNNRGRWNNRYTPGWGRSSNNSQNASGSQTSIPSQKDIRTMLPPIDCPYKGWHLYMREVYKENSESVQIIKILEGYWRRNPSILKDIDEKQSFLVDMKALMEDETLKQNIPELKEMVNNKPQNVINMLGLAAHQVVWNNLETSLREEARAVLSDHNSIPDGETLEKIIPNAPLPVIHARLINAVESTQLKNLRANYYGKLVSVKGTVVRVSSIKPYCKQMAFTCCNCRSTLGIIQPEGKYLTPTSCPQEECQSRTFLSERCHKLTQTVDCQALRLQELINDDQREGGRVPRTVDCEVKEDLVDSCIPGDTVTITGIVKVNQSEESKGGKAEKSLFQLYVDVSSIINTKAGKDAPSVVGIEFSLKDYYAIEKIQSEDGLFKLLVASLCPAIYGHEMVKAGLILCLFGGCSKNEGCGVPVRGDPHILVVGDPGLGKSQMLQACANVAPRGVFVCGNTTTTSGLTVTLTREAGGDHALEGGALVLADQGVCCIDEFDKMTSQHQALLEAMEQQSISLAKAGIVCSLPARTSILAAANPIGGHYNKARTVAENIKMSGPLLSRFDLVFILLDKPDEELDSLLSEHVMSIHGGGRSSRGKMGSVAFPRVTREDIMNASASQGRLKQPLSERLKYKQGEDIDCIPHQLYRKYICYARKYVKPKLTPNAAKILQDFYLELRQKLQNSDSTPITTRQLESMIRLSEARARCELREEVTEEDAKDVVDIMKFSMIDTYSDEFGFIDFQRSQHGSGMSNRSQMKKFVSALQKLSDSTYKSLFSVDEMRQLSTQIGLKVRDFGDFIASLNHQGYLIKKAPKIYQLLIAD